MRVAVHNNLRQCVPCDEQEKSPSPIWGYYRRIVLVYCQYLLKFVLDDEGRERQRTAGNFLIKIFLNRNMKLTPDNYLPEV